MSINGNDFDYEGHASDAAARFPYSDDDPVAACAAHLRHIERLVSVNLENVLARLERQRKEDEQFEDGEGGEG